MLPQRLVLPILLIVLFWPPAAIADGTVPDAAVESVTAAELQEHVVTLADDVFEGRGVGTRGGRAAAQYIVRSLRNSVLTPGGTEDEFFQPCDGGGRNILAVLPGTDPQLRDEYIVVGAHYDHVGDGQQGRPGGPIGVTYNGADDNASGVAALLEAIEAFGETGIRARRSILFAFWDGEEVGLVGSKNWFAAPTIPTSQVRLAVNIDMVGRLRDGRLQILGTRTGYGLRRLMAGPIDESLQLDFSWELSGNSDHWPFVEHQIPVVMLHTGLHDDYHKPSDDADKVNYAGLQAVTRYLLATLVEIGDSEWLPAYRPARRYESLAARRGEHPAARSHAAAGGVAEPRPRLGISWRTDEAEPASVFLTQVFADSPAASAGLAVDDRIYAVNAKPFVDADEFRRTIVGLLDAEVAEFTLMVETRGRVRTIAVPWRPHTLAAKAAR